MVDIMPTDEKILGFSSRWYKELFKEAQSFNLCEDFEIKLITMPYLLATKLEAFLGRGGGDYLGSHDLDDIVTLLDGRENVLDDILSATKDIRGYLKLHFSGLLSQPKFISSLEGHLAPYGLGIGVRKTRILNILSAASLDN